MPKFFTSLFLFVLTVFFGNLAQIYACSCVAVPSCQLYNSSDLIFVGRVIDKKSGEISDETGKEINYGIESTVFEVSETISGEATSKISIVNKSGTSCDTEFDSGETYLVFADGNAADGFRTDNCSGNQIFDKAGQTLAELSNIKSIDKGGKLYGEIFESFFIRDGGYVPMRGVDLKVQEIGGSNKIFNTTADGNGKYEIILPEGNYKITPKIPPYANFDEDANDLVFVKNHGCAQKNFGLKNDAQISGKVLDVKGKPVKDIRIELVSINKEEPNNWQSETAYSEKNGEFFFFNIPSGAYTISVNFARESSEEMPFPATFYPKSADRRDAKVFNVGLGEKLENIIFRLPPRIAPQPITGTVVFPDGSKAAGMTVTLERRYSMTSFSSTETDENGSFKLNGFVGESYTFRIDYYGDETEKNDYSFEKAAFTLEKDTEPFRIVLKKNFEKNSQN